MQDAQMHNAGLDPHPRARVEYWFWKVHVGGLAFLVDFILRPRTGLAETRVSLWRDGVGRVVHLTSREWSARRDAVVIGPTTLRPGGSQGSVEDIDWDLTWDTGERMITPLPGLLARAGALDLSIRIHPDALFGGHVTVGGERFDLSALPGTFTQYWGRRLPDRWVWLSATSFDGDPDRRVEAIYSTTRLWGILPSPVSIGQVWTRGGGEEDHVVWPLNGRIRTTRWGAGFRLDARRLGRRAHNVAATWGEPPANDLGEGIIQTLHGDLSIDGVNATRGTVGVETRAWESLSGPAPRSRTT